MGLYDVFISGCDASTKLYDLTVTAEQAEVLDWLVGVVAPASIGPCKPKLQVGPAPIRPHGQLCNECWDPIPAGHPRARDEYGEWQHITCRELA
jgi:hypothetical protein